MALTVTIDKPVENEEFQTSDTIPVEITVTNGTAISARAKLSQSGQVLQTIELVDVGSGTWTGEFASASGSPGDATVTAEAAEYTGNDSVGIEFKDPTP